MSFTNYYKCLGDRLIVFKNKLVIIYNIGCNICHSMISKKDKPVINPYFSCIAIKTNQIVQCYNDELRHHNHIRYAYFNLDKIIRTAIQNSENLLVRIIDNRGVNKDNEITRFYIDFSDVVIKNNIIDRISTKEILLNGDNGHIIIRIPDNQIDGDAKVVYIYNRNEINK